MQQPLFVSAFGLVIGYEYDYQTTRGALGERDQSAFTQRVLCKKGESGINESGMKKTGEFEE